MNYRCADIIVHETSAEVLKETIDQSFLSDQMKDSYKEIVSKRFKRFESFE